MIKRFFKGLLIFILGMIFGIVALFGGIYLAATKIKVKDIASMAGYEDAIGEKLAELSLVETVVKLADTNTTIGTYFEYFPTLNDGITDLVNNGDLGKFVNIDLEELKSYTISNVGDKVMDAVSIVVSLDTLSKDFGFELPDNMPIFKTAENGGYEDYIKITPDGQNEVTNKYYNDRKGDIYYKSGEEYVKAYNTDGTLVSSATAPFYYKGCLVDIPVTDAITGLSNILNFDTLTFKDLQDKIGVDIFGEEDSLIKKIINEEDTLGSISKSLMDNVNKLTLGDFDITISADDGVISKIIDSNTQIGSLTGADGYDKLDFGKKVNDLTLSDLGLNLTGTASKVLKPTDTIGALTGADGYTKKEIEKELNDLTLNDFGFELTGVAAKVLYSTDKIGALTGATGYIEIDINNRINALTLNDMGMDFSDDELLSKILKADDTIESLQSANTITDRIDTLKISDLGINLSGIASKIIYSNDTIETLKNANEINDRINALTISDLDINFTGVAGNIILSTDTIGSLKNAETITGRINALTISDLGINIEGVAGRILKANDSIATLKGNGEISNRINNLEIENLITGTDNNALLKALTEKGATVGNLSEKISNLTFTDVYGATDVFVKISDNTTTTKSNYMKFTKNDKTYIQSNDGRYMIKDNASVWLILLYTKTGTWGNFEYTFNDMKLLEFGNSMSGLTNKFSVCTMQELYEVGIITEAPSNESIAKLTLTGVVSQLNGNS